MKLYLASTSPRRKTLLREAGFTFEVIHPKTEEIEAEGESAKRMVERFAMEKALAGFEKVRTTSGGALLISADTTVVSPNKGKILNKPLTPRDAEKMLRIISGKQHTVLTGYVICQFQDGMIQKWHSEVVKTLVQMRSLTARDIRCYVKSGEPMDKAGAYAAQGIGMCLIESIRGSYSNVVGLPMAELVHDLEKKFSITPKWKTE